MSTELSWRDLVPDTLQGWQEHEEAIDRLAKSRDARFEVCTCVQTDVEFDARMCPKHSRQDLTGDDSADVPAFPAPPSPYRALRFWRGIAVLSLVLVAVLLMTLLFALLGGR